MATHPPDGNLTEFPNQVDVTASSTPTAAATELQAVDKQAMQAMVFRSDFLGSASNSTPVPTTRRRKQLVPELRVVPVTGQGQVAPDEGQ